MRCKVLAKLYYEEELVGLRIKLGNDIVDMDVDVDDSNNWRWFIQDCNIFKIELQEYNGVLATSDEHREKDYYPNISKNKPLVKQVVSNLLHGENTHVTVEEVEEQEDFVYSVLMEVMINRKKLVLRGTTYGYNENDAEGKILRYTINKYKCNIADIRTLLMYEDRVGLYEKTEQTELFEVTIA